MEPQPQKSNLLVPAAIIIAGALIALSLYMTQGGAPAAVGEALPVAESANLDQMRPVSADDHIRGNPDAPIKIVEYSDTECPFCKRFHETMQQVMDEYGDGGKVAWVYRHFPLDQLHPKADKEAEAIECANELGGNDAFWKYADRIFEVTPSNNGLDAAELPKIAEFIGLDREQFNSCLSSGKYAQHIEDDTQNAIATGGAGTPWSIVVTASGKQYPLSGAQPYESVKQLIEQVLSEL